MNKFFSYDINELKLDELFIEYLEAFSNISNKLNYFRLNDEYKNIISPFNKQTIDKKNIISFYDEPLKIYSSNNIDFNDYSKFYYFFTKFKQKIKFQFHINNSLFIKNSDKIRLLPLNQIFETQKKNINIKIETFDHKNYKNGMIKDMQLLHEVVSGKKTRSDMTWEINEKMIKSKKGFLMKLSIDNKVISYSLFFHNKIYGITFSSCTLREYFKIAGINHLIKWTGISFLKKQGVRYYDLGITNYLDLNNRLKITEKEKKIAYFKSRFNGIRTYHLQFNDLLSLDNFKNLSE